MDRQHFIGGTDVSAILGENKWRTKFAVWLEKTGQNTNPIVENEAMEWGKELEPVVANKWARVHGKKIVSIATMLHPACHFLGGSPDFIIVSEDGDFVEGLEIKTSATETDWGDGAEDIPIQYWMQCQWYCGILRANGHDMDRWHMAVLFHGNHYADYVIPFDEVFFNNAVDRCVEFWNNHVVTQTPPDVDGSDAAKAYVTRKAMDVNDNYLIPDMPTQDMVAEYRAIKERIKMDESILATYETRLMDCIGQNKGIAMPDGKKLQWIRSAPTPSVAWKNVAHAMNAPQSIIDQYSTVGTGKSYLKEGK